MRLITYDCEVFKYDWLVVFKNYETKQYTCIWNDNEALAECIQDNRLYFGFNNKHYDKFIIHAIVKGLAPNEVKQVNDFIIKKGGQGWECPLLKGDYFDFPNVDLKDDTQKGLSLKAIEGHFYMNIKESDVDFNIDRPLTAEERAETELYCKHDVDATEELIGIRKGYLQNKINLGNLAGLDSAKALSMTNAKLTAAMLKATPKKHDDERDYQYPDNLKKEYIPQEVFDFFDRMHDKTLSDDEIFKGKNAKLNIHIGDCPVTLGFGGIHAAIPNFFWEQDGTRGMWNEDVGSYYPHLCTINGYTSRNIPSPKIYEEVLDTRMKAKASGDKVKANALKLVCNTTYGCMKNQYNALYDPLMARSVCISGQLYLLELAEHCYKDIPGLQIVQLNTDGMMVECDKKDYPTLTALCNEWQKRTGFELEEDTIVKICQKDVNNYIEVQSDGTPKAKGGYLVKGVAPAGAFNVNNTCKVVADSIKEYFLHGTPVEETITNDDNIFDFQIIAKAGAKYKEAYWEVDGQPQSVQKVNRVYATTNVRYGRIYKVKAEDDSEEKIESLPEHCIVDNENLLSIEDVDKSFYIEMAQKRVNDFKGIKPEKKARKSKMATSTKKNVYQKLIEAREMLLSGGTKQSGKNMNLAFKYFELSDIVPAVTKIFNEIGLIAVDTFTAEIATLTIVNTDAPEEKIDFTAPFNQIAPIVSNSGKQVTNNMQALGASITYMRRYLYQIAMDICVNDEIEPTINKDTNSPATAPAKSSAPATPQEREAVKEELTAPADGASELQIKGLKKVIKEFIAVEPEKGRKLGEKIAVETSGFTNISKADCEELINGISDKIKEKNNG